MSGNETRADGFLAAFILYINDEWANCEIPKMPFVGQ